MNNEIKNANSESLLTVSPSPHIRHGDSTRRIMLDVIIALIPALIWGVICFGIRALAVVLVSVVSCVIFEFGFQKLLSRKVTIDDLSAAVTGLLLGLNLPATVPYWIPVIGSLFAIVVVKQLFGGIGKNFMNPALAARVFLFAWPSEMTTFTQPFKRLGLFASAEQIADITASATPLATLKSGNLPDISWVDLITGKCGGTIGEISSVLLILGGIYLLARKVISWHIPVSLIGSVALLTALFPQNNDVPAFVLCEIFAGGLILGAFFMATDYATSPVTPKGRLIYGALCGAIIVFIRYFGGYPEGVSFGILIMNTLVYYLDKFTKPRVFGKQRGGAKHG
ncbi:MAG: RnfABCDGE type electron transport complex subunit D [Clostridia bacterium]|nr:RnfABCDGE type electron transport complex subunit D [Clostridia bacterium]